MSTPARSMNTILQRYMISDQAVALGGGNKVDYKQSYCVGIGLMLQDWDEKREKKKPKTKPNQFKAILNVFVALFWIGVTLFVSLCALFIESPIRWLFCKGNIKDKIKHWFSCWRSLFEGMGLIKKR